MEEEHSGQATRIFEQPSDALSFYSDFAQVIRTGHEILLQFYETIPGPPSPPEGAVTIVRTRLRVTIVVGAAHATNIGKLLLQRVGEAAPPPTPGPEVGAGPAQAAGPSGSVSVTMETGGEKA